LAKVYCVPILFDINTAEFAKSYTAKVKICPANIKTGDVKENHLPGKLLYTADCTLQSCSFLLQVVLFVLICRR
jgi:hypothetical protein